jgi:DNA-binding beta-propeller fold protein YncE
MDRGQFDALTRLIATQRSRRSAIAALLGATLLGSLSELGAARRKGKRRDQRRRDGKGASGKKAKNKAKGNGKSMRRNAKDRPAQNAGAEATRCCATGNCTPGKGKNLAKCCYQGQDLTGKNFQGANLGSANFSGATLTNANLQGANAGKACFVDADLRGVRTNGSTNLGGAIYCRTQTNNGENSSSCDQGTPCCPTCDAANPCDDGEVCCNGRCIPGNCCDNSEQSTCDDGQICCGNICVEGACCAAADCPNEICQRRSCQDNACVYEPVFGEPGPRCQTTCCQDEQDEPVCCQDGATTCDAQGLCCQPPAKDVTCGVGTPSPKCDEVTDTCGLQVDCGDCAEKICQDGNCTGAGNTCQYTPVFGTTGTQCQTVCCRDASGNPDCCDAGTTRCAVSGRCTCTGNADCDQGDICCNGRCVVPVWNPQTTFGSFGFDPSEFLRPEGLAVTPDGQTVWVADSILERISVWTKSGATWTHATNFGDGPLNDPASVDVANDGLTAWVADTFNERISVWTKSGSTWSNTANFGTEGVGDNQFDFPMDVAVSADGNTVWVADGGNHRISIWSKSGSTWSPVDTFGSGPGNESSQFSFPTSVAIAADEQTVWVADADNNRVSVWGKSGSTWSNLTTFGPGVIGGAIGVDVASDGRTVFVTDHLRNQVSVWVGSGSNWTEKLTFGSAPLAEEGIAVSPAGDMAWVSDTSTNARVSVWARACPAT